MFGREYASATVQTCEQRSSLEKRERVFLVFVIYRKKDVEMAGFNCLGATVRKRKKKKVLPLEMTKLP